MGKSKTSQVIENFLASRTLEITVLPLLWPWDPKLHHFTVTATKDALEFHIPHQPAPPCW